jgi:hypothetical protein
LEVFLITERSVKTNKVNGQAGRFFQEQILSEEISQAQTIVGSMVAITTALYDTIEDSSLPAHLRKIQLANLLDHLRQLKGVIG